MISYGVDALIDDVHLAALQSDFHSTMGWISSRGIQGVVNSTTIRAAFDYLATRGE
jgi:hypothetical protein